uniref:Uncharacterized protein n=1 Tax=Odontella aurita TaxID=265563 RepID=A0A7S4KAF2_9STRA|mmetsp:Transcript_8039/g.23933  ORF Transcript_8039/g.23933 Transcript_8039/m.23933 type:complete len:733 (+) Transcript_8039:167-2365(+)|eukprot:CAMPEP_0113551464 /NCGR_PEP_ID=MMETSP0015_2-20120614/14539_1 /TAXON_ID=2838 /ORGANISM="Odontella" /LENGTH=732 /DNA_ID=CAMNT_0000452359 /DNA_START=155 /DNA_END=2353 /DNA_ORIENTATION=- /assembly_acc=CAM_ASM_000160
MSRGSFFGSSRATKRCAVLSTIVLGALSCLLFEDERSFVFLQSGENSNVTKSISASTVVWKIKGDEDGESAVALNSSSQISPAGLSSLVSSGRQGVGGKGGVDPAGSPPGPVPDGRDSQRGNESSIPLPRPTTNEERSAALSYLRSLQARYDAQNISHAFAMRGNGWLYKEHRLLLALQLPGEILMGNNVLYITDVSGEKCDPDLIYIWVRIAGPEIFSGAAKPLGKAGSGKRQCAWTFDFEMRIAGPYIVESKLLHWDPLASFDHGKCKTTTEVPPELSNPAYPPDNVSYPYYRAVDGFKFYDGMNTCCEVCTRTPGCVRWSIPALEEAHECELYFEEKEDEGPVIAVSADERTIRKRQLRLLHHQSSLLNGFSHGHALGQVRRRLRGLFLDGAHGPRYGISRNESTAYFLGCGWNPFMSLDFPCITATEDMIYGSNTTIALHEDDYVARASYTQRSCMIEDEAFGKHRGRWVRRDFFNTTECPEPMVPDKTFSDGGLQIMKNYGDHPICWHRDDFHQVGAFCAEPGCKFVVKDMWRSHLHAEQQWYGTWEQYGCAYRELTDSELQQCVNFRKIEKFDVTGASVASMVRKYLNQRLSGIQLAKAGTPGAISVELSSLSMPHMTWHLTQQEVREKLKTTFGNSTDRTHRYFFSGSFYTSEREIHINAARSLKFSEIAEEILGGKGWKHINAFGMSAAFAYDTAGQMDGLHIYGPPMKMIIVKFFHHLCDGLL